MKYKILILGINGMLGHKLFQRFSENENFVTFGTVRQKSPQNIFTSKNIFFNAEIKNIDYLNAIIKECNPHVIINCIGIIKQLPQAKDAKTSIYINSLFPHLLADIAKNHNSRVIHFSTDCIFSGEKGYYSENDPSDANDLYGRSKFLGELNDSHCVTIRTSIIGHELGTKLGLLEWFLSQNDAVHGYTEAFFSGFPTMELADIISNYIIPNQELKGIFNISSQRISKYDLLKIIAGVYNHNVVIKKDNSINIDRSLDATYFKLLTNYKAPDWKELIEKMFIDYKNSKFYQKNV